MKNKQSNASSAIDVLVNEIIKAAKSTSNFSDVTFPSVVQSIKNGKYTITDTGGALRNVKCAIPNIDLKVGTQVWVKIPAGNISKMHICGIM